MSMYLVILFTIQLHFVHFSDLLYKFIYIFSGQILSYQLPLLETLEQELSKLEDSIHQPYNYFKVLYILIKFACT